MMTGKMASPQASTNPTITVEDHKGVVNALNHAVSYCEAHCDSIEEIQECCSGRLIPVRKMEPQLLGVHELEISTGLHGNASLTTIPHLRSPRLMCEENGEEKLSQQSRFPFLLPRTDKRPTRRNTAPIFGMAAKNSFLLGALHKTYSIESVSTAILRKDQYDGEMFMPTYTVIILGELNVGKSTLCTTFFRSGMCSGTDFAHSNEEETESYLLPSTDTLDQEARHHVYERPLVVDGHCARIRILDINAEKHMAEASGRGDFEPYLQMGDAYVLAYSVTDRGTFKTVVEILSRMAIFHAQRIRSLPIVLVGNKCDLARRRQVSTANGIKLSQKYGIKFIETSASLNQNVTTLFEGVLQQIRRQQNLGTDLKTPRNGKNRNGGLSVDLPSSQDQAQEHRTGTSDKPTVTSELQANESSETPSKPSRNHRFSMKRILGRRAR